MAESEQHVSYRRVFSLLRLPLLAVCHVVHLVDESDDYFSYFACYGYAKRNNLQNQMTLHLNAAMLDQLEIPHKVFQNWIVLRMLGIRDCMPLKLYKHHRITVHVRLSFSTGFWKVG